MLGSYAEVNPCKPGNKRNSAATSALSSQSSDTARAFFGVHPILIFVSAALAVDTTLVCSSRIAVSVTVWMSRCGCNPLFSNVKFFLPIIRSLPSSCQRHAGILTAIDFPPRQREFQHGRLHERGCVGITTVHVYIGMQSFAKETLKLHEQRTF